MPDNLDKLAAEMKGGQTQAQGKTAPSDDVSLWDQTAPGATPPAPSGSGSLADTLQSIWQGTKDVLAGAGKGALHTAKNIGAGEQSLMPQALRNTSYGRNFGAGLSALTDWSTPTNTAQKIGYGAEQAGEFLLPTGAETAAVKGITAIPRLAEAGALVRPAVAALSSGLVNKAQGGDFSTGALAGGAGGALSEGLRAAAPLVAESALGVRGGDRAFKASPGRAILDETTGFKPSTIAEQAQQRAGQLGQEQQAIAAASPAQISLREPRDVVTQAMQQQANKNAIPQVERLNPLREQISVQGTPRGGFPAGVNPIRPPGAIIPPDVSASEALNLRQGVSGFQADKPWTGKVSSDPLTGTIKRTYGALTGNIHSAIPELEPIDTRLHNLIPVADRAAATDLNASTLQRIFGRLTRPTGALVGTMGGGAYGYREGGVPGAIAGGVAGLAAPEIIGSPTVQMMIARGMNRGATPAVRALLGGGIQATRQSLYSLPEQ